MSGVGEGVDVQGVVAVRCADSAGVGVRLVDRAGPEAGAVRFAVEVSASGLAARLDGVVGWVGATDGLAGFLAGLADDFRGWEGERDWRTPDRDLTVRAVFRSGGHVGLTWVLRPWRTAQRGWEASVTTWLEGGEQLAALAADVGEFVDRG
ncbi:DUF6228 family protein [Kitasatospora sp. CB01950]|uniref:DUF6228 family protein n=1 Tax=Kitasatospora sp. CB01950 TaxID=1703930 RepID=UPI00093DCFAA|nr:DUF6228 family protein [Kitasatospora sp. CB01950]OKJ03302.1 hypothetical protein AMK19_26810 [Kitasatospora sp. CB01950]